MKLIHVALGVVAASILPSATADEPTSKPFTITVVSDVNPVSQPELRYPSYAGVRSLEGSCEVKFAVSTEGKADAIRVGACTSDVFRRAAKKVVEDMSFAPRSVAIDNQHMKIRWAMNAPTVTTASLD